MLGDGGERRAQVSPWQGAGEIVVGALTIAAVMAAVGKTLELVDARGISVSDRILQFALLAFSVAGTTLAARLALSVLRAGRDAESRSWTAGVAIVLGVLSAALLAAGLYAAFIVATHVAVGGSSFARSLRGVDRVGFSGLALAGTVLAATTLFVALGDRRAEPGAVDDLGDRPASEEPDSVDAGATEVAPMPSALFGPTILLMLIATIALVESAVDGVFFTSPPVSAAGGGALGGLAGSVADRIFGASLRFAGVPITLLALAVVALFVVGTAREPRTRRVAVIGAVAAVVGALGVGAMVDVVWHALRPGSNSGGSSLSGSAWARAGLACESVGSGAIGIAVCDAVRRWRLLGRAPHDEVARADTAVNADAESAPSSTARARWTLREQAPIAVIGLSLAALGVGGFVVLEVAAGASPLAVGDMLAQFGSFTFFTAAFALAAVVLTVVADATAARNDAPRRFVDGVGALVALASLAASGYVISYVLVSGNRSHSSMVTQTTISQRHQYVAVALATALLAVATLHLIWRVGQPSADDAVGDVPVADLRAG